MNTHDIDLPDLPPCFEVLTDRTHTEIRAYARAAIEADRKRRGEPVAWRYLTPTGWHATTDAARALGVAEHHTIEPLYAAPQPDDFSAQLSRIEDSMKAGARLTKHRFKLDAPQPAEPCASSVSDKTACGSENGDCDSQPADPAKRKRRYAQGSALGEFGIIPMCDQVGDEPVKVPSDDEILFTMRHLERHLKCVDSAIPTLLSTARALLARYGQEQR